MGSDPQGLTPVPMPAPGTDLPWDIDVPAGSLRKLPKTVIEGCPTLHSLKGN
jgi:hypothetical protein